MNPQATARKCMDPQCILLIAFGEMTCNSKVCKVPGTILAAISNHQMKKSRKERMNRRQTAIYIQRAREVAIKVMCRGLTL